MFFGKKEEKSRLPDLPPAKTPFNFSDKSSHEDELDEINGLPAFPDSPNHNRFSQAAIKDAVSAQNENEEENSDSPGTIEMREWSPSMSHSHESNLPSPGRAMENPPYRDVDEINLNRIPSPRAPIVEKKQSDVFVKIDKFHVAKNHLNEAREKLEEIDELIRKIRETKLREEQELSSWENDLAHIKARIKNVSEDIFEKA